MDKLIIPPGGSFDDAVIEHHFDLEHDAAFQTAAAAFESCLTKNAAACGMTQAVVSELCHLAADATTAAMNVAYNEGLDFGAAIARAAADDGETADSGPDQMPGGFPCLPS